MGKQAIFVTNIRKGRGRPKTAPSAVVRLPVAVIEAADAWADAQEDKPSRPEAIRRLVEIGLTAKREAALDQ